MNASDKNVGGKTGKSGKIDFGKSDSGKNQTREDCMNVTRSLFEQALKPSFTFQLFDNACVLNFE